MGDHKLSELNELGLKGLRCWFGFKSGIYIFKTILNYAPERFKLCELEERVFTTDEHGWTRMKKKGSQYEDLNHSELLPFSEQAIPFGEAGHPF
ncbi:hypothetical protein GCM10026987_34130 [Belliella aquatica]|uniref:Uncharacterized protein n=1 Tax=Belliella aquatica TaxID=1323734 RepID=A0ABQ1LXT0_9BACT|nr:hypothetical protein GCM10010993_08020 [Belliella aquatica]